MQRERKEGRRTEVEDLATSNDVVVDRAGREVDVPVLSPRKPQVSQ